VIAVRAKNLAILAVLANNPDGRAEFAELDRQLQAHAQDSDVDDESADATGDEALDGIDLIEAGLATVDGDSLRITETGRSVFDALEALRDHSLGQAAFTSLKLIDDLIGADERSRIFNLELRGGIESHLESEQELHLGDTGAVQALPHREVDRRRRHLVAPTSTDFDELSTVAPATSVLPTTASSTAPTILVRGPGETERSSGAGTWRARTSAALARHGRRLGLLWRQHLEQDPPKARSVSRSTNLNRAMFALVSLLVVIICAGAVIALTRVRSLQMEISSLQREMSPLKERLSRLDQAEKAREADKTREERSRQAGEKSPPQQAPLILSRDEIQLIRDYIKPAPVAGSSMTPLSVGDPVAGPTIPFPSPVTDKIPKLLGARFAIRNGAIIIVGKDRRQADAVLGPN